MGISKEDRIKKSGALKACFPTYRDCKSHTDSWKNCGARVTAA
jgi:hypothetical protein